jgi:AcrR family transcriptional regulator
MSPRKPAALRDGGDQNLRDHLIATAARLLAERGGGGGGLAVRDIAREAQVADGVLYNYFEDKEDLLAQALLAHVGAVMNAAPTFATAGIGELVDNLTAFIDGGLAVLGRVLPAFAGLLSQPGVLRRFHAMVGGDRAFTGEPGDQPRDAPEPGGDGLPAILRTYLRSEQHLARVHPSADIDATCTLVVGAIHGLILPPLLLGTSETAPPALPGLTRRLAETIVAGIGP